MTPKKEKLHTYHGVADCYGIRTLALYDELKIGNLVMQATLYRHRHAVYFEINLREPLFLRIAELVQKNAYADALRLLKGGADGMLYVPDEHVDSWQLIPDRRLDPWHSYTVLV